MVLTRFVILNIDYFIFATKYDYLIYKLNIEKQDCLIVIMLNRLHLDRKPAF